MLVVKKIFLCGVFIFLLGCGSDTLPNPFVLDRLRVLALVADTPEAAPGDTVTITPVVSDPKGNGRTLYYSVEACLDPGISYGAEPNCDVYSSAYKTVLSEQQVSGLSSPHYTGVVTSTLSITLPQAALAYIGKSTADQYNGVPYLVLFKLRAADGVTRNAFKRIIISSKSASERNTNPVLASGTESKIKSEGNPLASRPSEKISILPNLKSDQQVYLYQNQNGVLAEATEKFEILWYVNEGSVLPTVVYLGETATYTPPDASVSAMLSVLVLDSRGGAAFGLVSF